MEEYEVVTAVIRSVFPKPELMNEDRNITEFPVDDEIMEFLPSEDND